MDFWSGLAGELDFLKSSSRSKGSLFLKIVLLEAGWMVAAVLMFKLLGMKLAKFAPHMQSIKDSMETIQIGDFLAVQNLYADTIVAQQTILKYLTIFGIITLVIFWAFKFVIYCTVNRRKLSLIGFLKFLLASVVWTAFLAIFGFIVQFVIYYIFKTSMVTSITVQLLVIFLVSCTLFLMFFWTISILTPLVMTGSFRRSLKGFFVVGLKSIRSSVWPILFSIVIFAVINVMLLIFKNFPDGAFLLLATLILLVFAAWQRIYFTAVWRKIASPDKMGTKDVMAVKKAPVKHDKAKKKLVRHKIVKKKKK